LKENNKEDYYFEDFELKHGEDRQFSAAHRYKRNAWICFSSNKRWYFWIYIQKTG